MKTVKFNPNEVSEVEVTSIHKKRAKTYDIEVEDVHHYILDNGIVSHNSSIICDNVSNGIEPVYLLEYERKIICKEWPEGLNSDNIKSILHQEKGSDFTYWQGEYKGNKYYYEPHNRGLCEIKIARDYGYQWLMEQFPDKNHKPYLVTTKDLSVEDHVAIQEVVQANVNQSVSKTVNLPKNYSFKKFKDVYMNAWKKSLIGLTSYREGSMESVLSDIDQAGKDKQIIKRDIKLPDTFINGECRIIKREGKKFYIHFSYLPGDEKRTFPVCMWINSNATYRDKDELRVCNKAARELARLALKCEIDNQIINSALEKAAKDYPHNRLGRMISLCLRHNVPREDILVAITDIEGDSVSSLLTSVRRFLAETIPDGTKLGGLACPSCKGTDIIIESGCKKCVDCGNQICG